MSALTLCIGITVIKMHPVIILETLLALVIKDFREMKRNMKVSLSIKLFHVHVLIRIKQT